MATEKLGGEFFANLNRNNSKIRSDRAIAITEDAQLLYKRELEDMEMKLKRLKRERENMIDLSPTSADSLILATDFNSDEFVKKDIKFGIDIRNLQIAIDIARERFNTLFVSEPELLTED